MIRTKPHKSTLVNRQSADSLIRVSFAKSFREYTNSVFKKQYLYTLIYSDVSCYNFRVDKLVEFWETGAKEAYKTAQGLFSLKRYDHSLFFCHLTIEKILKALVVQKTLSHPPRQHNLFKLSNLGELELTKEQLDIIDEINAFNITGRYDEDKYEFYKKATKEYAEEYLIKTNTLFLWLQKHLKK